MKNGTTSSLSDMLQDLFEDGKLVSMTPALIPLLDDFDRTDRLPASCKNRQASVNPARRLPSRASQTHLGTHS
jgi:hypothetical protein